MATETIKITATSFTVYSSFTWICEGETYGDDSKLYHYYVARNYQRGVKDVTVNISAIPAGAKIKSATISYRAKPNSSTWGNNKSELWIVEDGSYGATSANLTKILQGMTVFDKLTLRGTYIINGGLGLTQRTTIDDMHNQKVSSSVTFQEIYITIEYGAGDGIHYGKNGKWIKCNAHYGKDGKWLPVNLHSGKDDGWSGT